MISISDDKNHIVDTFEKLQIPWIWSVLGPTKDDVTKRRSVTILRTS
jgi:nicotinamide-nucleotide amidase